MKTLLALTRTHGLGQLFLRVPVGLILAAHGAQKLLGWFGGAGLESTGDWMSSIGLEPGMLMAILAGAAELFGGLALMVGVAVRPAAALNAVVMTVAILAVHLQNGLFIAQNGMEFALALWAACLLLMIQGAGSFSLDAVLHRVLKKEGLPNPAGG